jgi:N-acetylglucosamine-6-phosphate deacetylase
LDLAQKLSILIYFVLSIGYGIALEWHWRMNDGELFAWHYLTRRPARLCWQNGLLTAVEPSSHEPHRDLWVAPPLVDLQINGYAGIDFQRDELPLEALVHATHELRWAGCTRFLLTLITDEWPRLLERLRHLRKLRAASAELKHAIAGWHVEGPFLCAEPGFAGAHDPALFCDPTPAHLRELHEAAGDDPVLLTLAPERLESIAIISFAVSLGIKVSLGHTNAPHKRLLQAVHAGATAFTHLANGCPRLLDRHDNILWRVFETPGLTVSLIPDAIHVSPPLFRLIHRTLPAGAIYYTTDAMAAAGAPPGRHTLGKIEVTVGEDQVVRQPGSALFAGSALQPLHGVFRAAEMLEEPWQEAWVRFSDVPARLMGLPHGLQAGQPADLCLLRITPENWLQSLQVFVRGRLQPTREDLG